MKLKLYSVIICLFCFQLKSIAQVKQKLIKYIDIDNNVVEDKLLAYYISILEFDNQQCKKVDYYIKTKEARSLAFFTDTSCKVPIGKYISFHSNKIVEEKGEYINGKKEGVWLQYYATGAKKDSCFYSDNRVNNIAYSWYENGNVKEIRKSIENQSVLQIKGFWENGNISYEGEIMKKGRDGIWTYYHFNGKKSKELHYNSNVVFKSNCFNENEEAETCEDIHSFSYNIKLKNGIPLKKYLQKMLRMYDDFIIYNTNKKDFDAVVWLNISIDIYGNVNKVEVLHSNVESLRVAAIEIFKKLPPLQPVVEHNRRINVEYIQKFTFTSLDF